MEFVLNGRPTGQIDCPPQTTLLDFVRERGFTGAKEGCAEGECGACAVLLGNQPVNSCLVPLPAVAGLQVLTVEALADQGYLSAVQRAMVEYGGSQCGYCTPGFVVSMFAAHRAGSADIESLSGNLCRCTGYRPIRDAFRSLPPVKAIPESRVSMPTAIDYETEAGRFSRPCDLAEALRLTEMNPAAKFVAGNTDLGVMTNLRYERFPHLISLEGIPELREFRETTEQIEIGAALTLTEIEERWTTAPPVFHEWIRLFASRLIRNRATLGGNLATASPIGDSAPLLLALDAWLRLVSGHGERTVPLKQFFQAYRETELQPGELIRSIVIPKPLPERLAFYKVAKRRTDDISTVAAAFAQDGNVMRMGYGGVGPIPMCLTDPAQINTLRPISDHRGSAAYREAMAQSLFEKFSAEVAA